MSTKVKMQRLMNVSLIAGMGMEHVFCNIMHRFKSSFLSTGSVLFQQGDPILEASPICIIANGHAKVLIDPEYAQQQQQWQQQAADGSHPLCPPVAATSEAAGCRCVTVATESIDLHLPLVTGCGGKQCGPPSLFLCLQKYSVHIACIVFWRLAARQA